ncbi:MAG: class I SAM-dependent methyltransferase [Flavobacteriales bacterium]|jgi:SAM-dependent methyltransferase|nr:class I SAM-dependent methyltransferase [Flavobacteriales bacterium]MBK6753377.1 class I SAM-dependent methyltransferase [Flavobacteriales bacterium]MBK7086956.1 class I SAM-dependent methyltransferase [Flavobacteriales bacterium]MBK7269177.1 class I SAM-dependent methyltransferase [Flavobacteriales bacterium]MBK7753347.1 class I SAM-dependent methyltransferase [Flavobacteriales bacterium]
MKVHDNPSYQGPRPDLLRPLLAPERVLDVGCNNGAVARALKQRHPNVRVWGLEINAEALEQALPCLEKGWCVDLDRLDDLQAALGDLRFDHVIAGDVLEHTVKFQEITGILYMHLDPGGRIIVSVPNYGHWHTLWVFLTRKWPRNERGIFDKTHRTVIMWRNLPEFLRDCPGGELRLVKRNFRFFETKRFWKVNMLITYALFPLLLIPYVNDFVTMGYVFSIRKPASP